MSRKPAFDKAVQRVVANDNCTGCGACALLTGRVAMREDHDGFLRPVVVDETIDSGQAQHSLAQRFDRVCPGRRVAAPPLEREAQDHAIFGRHVSVWKAWAIDPDIRERGSSGGVLTALASWLVESGQVTAVQGISQKPTEPRRSVPVRIMSREEALGAAGSRYAPVASLAGADLSDGVALVAKPCEVAAARSLVEGKAKPIMLSFFCAGTPSQRATDGLIEEMGLDPHDLASLKYRGDGWPGYFTAVGNDGVKAARTYSESWGKHLGRDLQMRCKLCVDGTGEAADVAVGDFWETDDAGYPLFAEQDGESIAIARTARGHELLLRAAAEGVIVLEPAELEKLVPVQPLQVKRRKTLRARLVGRALAGYRTPKYPGYSLWKMFMADLPLNLRTAAGSFVRSAKSRVKK